MEGDGVGAGGEVCPGGEFVEEEEFVEGEGGFGVVEGVGGRVFVE